MKHAKLWIIFGQAVMKNKLRMDAKTIEQKKYYLINWLCCSQCMLFPVSFLS